MSSNWRVLYPPTAKNDSIVVSMHTRSNFGRLLRREADERRSLVIEKRGTPKAVLLSIRDDLRLAAPEPEEFRLIGEESRRKGTNIVTPHEFISIVAPHFLP
jgi:prevent-host-death family protein